MREPVTPGEVLKKEFLDPMSITAYQLCKDTGLGQTQVSEIIKGKRAITDETDAALSKYFGLSRGYWRRMQVSYEQRKKARPWQELAQERARARMTAILDDICSEQEALDMLWESYYRNGGQEKRPGY